MYFANRFQAGRMLASRLATNYKNEPSAVLAVNNGGVVVGVEIAKELNCILNMLLSEEINLPREPEAFGGITSEGNFEYNPTLTKYDVDEYETEYRGGIEEQKLTKLRHMTEAVGEEALVNKDSLLGHNVILVADGLKTTFPLELARAYLKPLKLKRLIVATPLAAVNVVDWMHIYADEIYCLSVIEEYTETDRYYYKNDVPDRTLLIKTVSKIVHDWV